MKVILFHLRVELILWLFLKKLEKLSIVQKFFTLPWAFNFDFITLLGNYKNYMILLWLRFCIDIIHVKMAFYSFELN